MSGATAISPDLAVRLGKLCGNGPELWLNMQARYDAWGGSPAAAWEKTGEDSDLSLIEVARSAA